jgi:uncharacterized Zn-finger protein
MTAFGRPPAAGQTASGSAVPSAATYRSASSLGRAAFSPAGMTVGAQPASITASMTGREAAAIICRRKRSEIVTEPFEIITVDTDRVACDGGGGPLGHPKVYLNLGEQGRIECPYCSRVYVLREGAHPHEHAH